MHRRPQVHFLQQSLHLCSSIYQRFSWLQYSLLFRQQDQRLQHQQRHPMRLQLGKSWQIHIHRTNHLQLLSDFSNPLPAFRPHLKGRPRPRGHPCLLRRSRAHFDLPDRILHRLHQTLCHQPSRLLESIESQHLRCHAMLHKRVLRHRSCCADPWLQPSTMQVCRQPLFEHESGHGYLDSIDLGLQADHPRKIPKSYDSILHLWQNGFDHLRVQRVW